MIVRLLLLLAMVTFAPAVAKAETPSEKLARFGQQLGIGSVVGDQATAMRDHNIAGLSGRWLQDANLFLGKLAEAPKPDVIANACNRFGGELGVSELHIRTERPSYVNGAQRQLLTVFINVSGRSRAIVVN